MFMYLMSQRASWVKGKIRVQSIFLLKRHGHVLFKFTSPFLMFTVLKVFSILSKNVTFIYQVKSEIQKSHLIVISVF